MVSAPEDDFTNFLDLGDFQLNFPPFESAGQHNTTHQDESHAMDMGYDERGDGGVAARESHMKQQQHQQQSQQGQGQGQGQEQQQQQQQQQRQRNDLNGHQIHSTMSMRSLDQTSAEAALGLNAQINYLQHQQHQQQQQQQHQQSIVPPTPNSVEMHAGAAVRYYQQIDPQSLAFLERYHQRIKEDQVQISPPPRGNKVRAR
ncbi:hypothetical protein GP486_008911 [Trichoglossum hirsutum]|uniref:Uncharacterized protein n=1 Tax=Trichoglossum hirsutum TaxID=265104 RepID=A0A9P8L0F0_9PEZI|nr:hypothetical protein GP486_008911 [Trichoglossum hirsutum]